jgi:hypothetical protein
VRGAGGASSRPTISSASSLAGLPAAGFSATSLPARSTATRSATRSTSSSLWLMKMTLRPSATKLAQRGEQRFALLRRQHRGRLVEDQDARPAVQRLEDLHALLLADRQVDPRASGSTCRPKRCARSSSRVRAPRDRRERPPQRLGADHHVVEHAQVVGQREVLVHHADAGSERRARVARRQRGAADLDAAGVGA